MPGTWHEYSKQQLIFLSLWCCSPVCIWRTGLPTLALEHWELVKNLSVTRGGLSWTGCLAGQVLFATQQDWWVFLAHCLVTLRAYRQELSGIWPRLALGSMASDKATHARCYHETRQCKISAWCRIEDIFILSRYNIKINTDQELLERTQLLLSQSSWNFPQENLVSIHAELFSYGKKKLSQVEATRDWFLYF